MLPRIVSKTMLEIIDNEIDLERQYKPLCLGGVCLYAAQILSDNGFIT